ncbi:alpha/beta hydrolase [candidate division KSB1 bacterium]|nr:alpha/beta hydrolase [candidate division KSB1 bacterium]
MIEQAFRFQNGNYELYGFLHHAEATDVDGSAPRGVVLCGPFAEEKQFSQRILVNLARTLASNGIHALRFDYMGYGDSDGNFEDCRLETYLNDIRAAVDVLRKKTNVTEIGLFGLRFGTTLAILAQEKYNLADFLVLWAPVLDCPKYIYDSLKANLAHQMVFYREVKYNRTQLVEQLMQGGSVNIEGHEVPGAFYRQISDIHLLKNQSIPKIATLMVLITKFENAPAPPELIEYQQLISAKIESASLKIVVEDLFWTESKRYTPYSENLFSETMTWLEQLRTNEIAKVDYAGGRI